jgi:membrane protease YdiL (CAAX protease family)
MRLSGPQPRERGPQTNPKGGLSLFLEPLILYGILFLPGALRVAPPPELAEFSVNRELTRILVYNLPALALVLYLRYRPRKAATVLWPSWGDLFSFLWALPALALTGFCVSRMAAFFPGSPGGLVIGPPDDIIGLLVMFASCVSTGYLEESYFRYYMGEKFRESGLGPRSFILVSTALFTLCHFYEGPWGTLNAFLAALMLALVYTRFRGLHGLALAHGLYNAGVYLLSLKLS